MSVGSGSRASHGLSNARLLSLRTGVQEHTSYLGSVTPGHEGQGLGGRRVSPPALSLGSHPLACLWTDAGTASRTATLGTIYSSEAPRAYNPGKYFQLAACAGCTKE